MIIDSHQHFFKYSPQKHPWIDDNMSQLKKDFLPEELRKIYKKVGVTGCVAVQAEQSEDETSFLLELADQFEFIKGVVGWVDLANSNISNRLNHFRAFNKLKGFRHLVQDEPDENFLLGSAFQNGLEQLEKMGFTYDLLLFPHQLKAATQVVRNFPDLNFVIDHIAKPDIKKGEMKDWSQSVKIIAREKNVYCKISGMVTEASWKDWRQEDFFPYLDVVFKSFGPDRIMFGSDWPVCLLAGDYQAVLDIIVHYVHDFSDQDKLKLFYTNAIDFYRLSDEQGK